MYSSLSFWLTSVSIRGSSSTYVVAICMVLFFLRAHIYIANTWPIYLYLGCYHNLTIVLNVVINIGVHIFFWINVCVLGDRCWEVVLLDYMVDIFMVSRNIHIAFHRGWNQMTFLSKMIESFFLTTTLAFSCSRLLVCAVFNGMR